MSIQKNSEIPSIDGSEGTKIKQYFHPHNTLNGIRFSLSQITIKQGKKSLKRMITYGNKDVTDTKEAWLRVLPYIKPKLNKARFLGTLTGDYGACKVCGSKNIVKNGTERRYSIPKQRFFCKDHNGAAGQATILKSGKLGKME